MGRRQRGSVFGQRCPKNQICDSFQRTRVCRSQLSIIVLCFPSVGEHHLLKLYYHLSLEFPPLIKTSNCTNLNTFWSRWMTQILFSSLGSSLQGWPLMSNQPTFSSLSSTHLMSSFITPKHLLIGCQFQLQHPSFDISTVPPRPVSSKTSDALIPDPVHPGHCQREPRHSRLSLGSFGHVVNAAIVLWCGARQLSSDHFEEATSDWFHFHPSSVLFEARTQPNWLWWQIASVRSARQHVPNFG